MTARPHSSALQVAHSSLGRLRVRAPVLRNDRGRAMALADALAALPGVIDVSVRPRTGSVLCRYDQRRMNAGRLVAAIRRHAGVGTGAATKAAGVDGAARRRAGSTLGRALVALFRELDAEVVEATNGRLDLGTLAGLGMLGAGAAEIAVTRSVPAPPWFSLAWWAFRTFTIYESPAVDERRPRNAQRAIRRRAAR